MKWQYTSEMTLRSSLTFAEATDKSPASIVMGDAAGFVHAVDAKTGRKLWVSNARLNEYNRITGAPVVHDGKVITPVSAIEVNYAGQDDYAARGKARSSRSISRPARSCGPAKQWSRRSP